MRKPLPWRGSSFAGRAFLAAVVFFSVAGPRWAWGLEAGRLGSRLGSRGAGLRRLAPTAATLQPGASVAVVGASGNVGKLVTKRLMDRGYEVRALCRDARAAAKLTRWLDADVDIAEVDVTSEASRSALTQALKGQEGVVVCTGTTAFPTKAWTGGAAATAEDVGPTVWRALTSNNFDRTKALAALDALGLNTPRNVDAKGVQNVAACVDDTAKRLVLMSSLGVTKRDAFPFAVLNAAGVLDAKAAGEEAVRAKAAMLPKCDWAVLRPGQLFGGPYDNNFYLGTLFALDKDAKTRAVDIARGDQVTGDTLRSTLAEVIVQSLEAPEAADTDFTVVNVQGDAPETDADLKALFQGLS